MGGHRLQPPSMLIGHGVFKYLQGHRVEGQKWEATGSSRQKCYLGIAFSSTWEAIEWEARNGRPQARAIKSVTRAWGFQVFGRPKISGHGLDPPIWELEKHPLGGHWVGGHGWRAKEPSHRFGRWGSIRWKATAGRPKDRATDLGAGEAFTGRPELGSHRLGPLIFWEAFTWPEKKYIRFPAKVVQGIKL